MCSSVKRDQFNIYSCLCFQVLHCHQFYWFLLRPLWPLVVHTSLRQPYFLCLFCLFHFCAKHFWFQIITLFVYIFQEGLCWTELECDNIIIYMCVTISFSLSQSEPFFVWWCGVNLSHTKYILCVCVFTERRYWVWVCMFDFSSPQVSSPYIHRPRVLLRLHSHSQRLSFNMVRCQ